MWSRMTNGPKGQMNERKTKTPRHCPVPDCPWTVPSSSTNPHASLKEHLITEHSETHPSDYLTPQYCNQHGFHPCLKCDTPTAIFTTEGHLRQHVTKKHSRTKTNLQLVLQTYRHSQPETERQWKDSLAYLHKLQLSPPPFRRSIWHKLKPPIKAEFYTTYNTVVSWILEATPPLSPSVLKDDRPPQHDIDASPFWKLLILLESLLLAPIKGTVHLTYANAFRARLSWFKTGRLEELHHIIWNPAPLPKQGASNKKKQKQRHRQQHHPSPSDQLPQWRLHSAQQLADLGNYRAAVKRLTTNTPPATLTASRVERCQNELFPQRQRPPPSTRSQGQPTMGPPAAQYLKLTDESFERALRQMTPGTASGPFSTCIDTIVSMALHKTTKAPDATRPYFRNIKSLIQLVVTAQVPTTIQPILASNYFLALHKDMNNLERLRPIGIGTAIRRVAAKTALVHLTDAIQPLLLKGGQYGIQVPGGVDFVAQTTAMAVRQYIDRNPTTTDSSTTSTTTENRTTTTNPSTPSTTTDSRTRPPSRALVMLDLTNMFNNVSRTEARKVLLEHDETTPLVPLFDLLTQHTCKQWYFDENKQAKFLRQEEGFPQGCPLSPLFSCLVLLALTNKLNKEQAKRAQQRQRNNNPHDDEMGGVGHTASIMDDTSVCLPHCDVPWFLKRFEALGQPLGIILNKSKTTILTSTDGTPPDTLDPTDKQHLEQALSFLSPADPAKAEITNGVRFLGQPIGSSKFAQQYIQNKVKKMHHKLDCLLQLPDLQTKHNLFKFTMVSSLLHLLPSDVYLAHTTTNPRTTLWSSPTTLETEKIVARFLSELTSLPETEIRPSACLIAAMPQRLGGLGYQQAATSAYPRLLTQTARAIALATSSETPIPRVHRRELNNWQESTDEYMTIFRKTLSLYAKEYAEEQLYTPKRYDHTTHNRLLHHTVQEHTLPRLVAETPPEQRTFLPGLLSPLTSLALSLPLTATQFRYPNEVFQTAIKRKLRLPLFVNDPTQSWPQKCRCSKTKTIDPLGDHLFSCTSASKTALSNAIRDTLFDVLRQLAPAAGTVETTHDVHVEPPGLAPQHERNIRPADVGMLLRKPHRNDHFQYVAIDITIPPPQQPLPIHDPSDHKTIATMASRAHHEAARAKFCRDPQTATHLLHNGVYLLPFTVDHLGSLGSFANTLLFPSEYHHPTLSTTEPPPWDNPFFGKDEKRSKSHPAAYALFQQLTEAPNNMLTKANKNTKKFSYPEANIYTIGHYAKASLGHAIISALANHANNNITAIKHHQSLRKTRITQLQNLATPCFAPVTPIYSPAPMAQFITATDTTPLLCELPA